MEAANPGQDNGLAVFLWRTLPRLAERISTTVAVALTDGTCLYQVDRRFAYAAPAVFLIGLMFGWFHVTFRTEATYTASLAAMGVLLFAGAVSLNLGVHGWFGYVVGEFVLRSFDTSYIAYVYPYTYVVRQRVPMLLSYVLLAALVFCLPLVATMLGRSVGQWKLPARYRKAAAAIAAAVSLAALVYLWAQSTATLIRPVYTWVGGQPTTTAIEPLQRSGWVLSLMAVAGYLLRLILESKAGDVSRDRFVPARITPGLSWVSRLPRAARYVISGAGTALLLSGLFASWLDFIVAAAVVIGLRFGREPILRRIPRWIDLMRRVPLLPRLAIAGYISYWIATQVISSIWFTSSGTFRPILACVIVSMILFLFVLPDLYQARSKGEIP